MKGIARPDIKPAFAERNIPVALAVDENYLPYAAVTINSLVSNTKSGNLDVFLLHAGISETAKADFFKGVRTCENLSLRFVDIGDAVKESAAGRFIQKNYLTVTALFRLFIPKVFVAYEKLVYLDVDLVVCEDLSELYAADLGGCLFGAVHDFGIEDYVRTTSGLRDLAEKYGFSEWDGYVNSGVLLMDLAALRSADLLERLLPVAVDAARFCCDQDALNFICKGRIFHLNPKWNMLMFPSSYARQLMAAGGQLGIVHFAGRLFKPWNHPWPLHAHLWWGYVEDLDFAAAQWHKIFGGGVEAVECGEGIAVTVIVPVYNAERYLFETLASLSAQTLRNIEIICIDDGSTDGSRAIIQNHQRLDSRVKLLSQHRQGPGSARNAALDVATGEYVYFLDADDRIVPGDALLRAYEQAKRDGLDMLLAAATTIAEDGRVLQRDTGINRRLVPQEPVFAPEALGAALLLCAPLGPCGKFYRRAFLEKKKLRFPLLKRSEDFPMVGVALALSSRIGVFAHSVYERRIGVASSLESTKDETPLIFFEAEQLMRDSLRKRRLWGRFKTAVYSAFVSRLAYNLQAVRNYSSFRSIIAKYCQERKQWIRWDGVVLPEWHSASLQLVKDIEKGMDEEDQIALFVKLRETNAVAQAKAIMQQQLDEAQKSRSRAWEQYGKVNAELGEARKRLQERREQLDAAQKSRSRAWEQYGKVNTELGEARKRLQERWEQLDEAQKSRSKGWQQYDKVNAELKKANRLLNERWEQREKLQCEIKACEKKYAQLLNEYDKCKNSLLQATAENSTMKDCLDRLRDVVK